MHLREPVEVTGGGERFFARCVDPGREGAGVGFVHRREQTPAGTFRALAQRAHLGGAHGQEADGAAGVLDQHDTFLAGRVLTHERGQLLGCIDARGRLSVEGQQTTFSDR